MSVEAKQDGQQNGHDGVSLSAVFRARCPQCRRGKVLEGVFKIRKSCQKCGYDFYPEPGFYLGAMVVGFFTTAALTIPAMVVLKLKGVEMGVLIAFPFVEFLFLGTFLMFYCRILWLHLEHRITRRLNRR